MSGYRNNNSNDLGSWLLVAAALVVFWPVGLVLLFRKLMGPSNRRGQVSRHPYDMQREAGARPGTQGVPGQGIPGSRPGPQGRQGPGIPRQGVPGQGMPGNRPGAGGAPGTQGIPWTPNGQPMAGGRRRTPQAGRAKLNRGKGLTVLGAVVAAVFGLGCLPIIPEFLQWGDLQILFGALLPCLGFACAGLVTMYAGLHRSKKSKRYRKYLALIGKRQEVSVATLAQAMPVSVATACDDLQDMLDDGILPTGYLDMSSGRLILSDEGIQDSPEPEPESEPEEEEDTSAVEEAADAVLAEIRAVNDAIEDPVMSEKINRIGEITSKIFTYQQKNPGKDSQLRSFLSYYLPTTLRILKAYAQMEAQGIEGENISAAKARIEGMMDKVVEGFEKQLDRLFQNDAMDITTDVEVLERMLEKDGLSGSGLTLGG